MILSSVMLLAVSLHAGQSIDLSWTPAVSTNVAGYKVYYGTQSESYSNSVTAGNTTNITISGFCAGKTYFFSATTYNSAGNESSFASEMSYTVPSVPAKPGRLTVLKLTPEARIEKISYWQSTSESVTNLFQ